MKVPISWLREYVDFDDTVQRLADRLTFSGVEVEGIEQVGGDYAGLVVGEVVAVERHPEADRLTICQVQAGGDPVQVVCGAPNVAAGQKVPFAPLGAVLPNGMKMKKAKIRQVESFGMLLAEDEVGVSDDHSGLMLLDPACQPGTPLAEILGPPEVVLDLEITPNRPDCLCLIGIAREVAVLYGSALKWPAFDLRESGPAVEECTRVDVEDTLACPRYTARVLKDIQIGPSPAWMQKRLTLAGIRPINNVVDITNYVMLESGHPLHAFDQGLLAEGRIIVRRARPGEGIRTLDDVERKLTEEMLVIADPQGPVAIAGVMGGAGSEIRTETTTVLLESACFDPLRTRSTSRQLALSTESSYRFERGVDAHTVEWASQRAAALMAEYAGGQIAAGVIDVYPAPVQTRAVTCGWNFVRSLTGMDVEDSDIQQILDALEMPVMSSEDGQFTIQVPTFRGDIERDVDVVEEVARIHGLDQIPTPPPRAEMVPGADDDAIRARTQLTSNLAGLGLREIMNYSLTAPGLLDLFDPNDGARRIVLPHPISTDQSVLRPSLIPQMVETLGRNHARQLPESAFFEAGRVFWRAEGGELQEADRIAIGLLGPVGRGPLEKRQGIRATDMYSWIKGVLEGVLAAQGIAEWVVSPCAHSVFERGQAVEVRSGERVIGVMGLVRPSIRKEWRLSEPVAVAELDVPALTAGFGSIVKAKAVSVYPAISRDMALVVDQSVAHTDILRIIRKNAKKDLEHIELFDIFEGDAIGEGKKSMAYSITYRSEERTLTDEDANRYHEKVKDAIRGELDVVIRES